MRNLIFAMMALFFTGLSAQTFDFSCVIFAPSSLNVSSSEKDQDRWIFFEIPTGDVTGREGNVSVSIAPTVASAATFSGASTGSDAIVDGLAGLITYDEHNGRYSYYARGSEVEGEGSIDYTFTATAADGNQESFTHTIDWSEPIGPLDFEGSVSYSDRTFLGTFTGADGTTKITVTWPDGTESFTEDGQGARGADYSGTIGHSQEFPAGEYSVTLEDENTVLGPFTFTLE